MLVFKDKVEDNSITPVARAGMAGIGGVLGSYGLAGFEPSFIAAPITGFLAREMPAIVIRYSILFLGSLGQKLNLFTAIGISILLLGLVTLVGIKVSHRFEIPWLDTIVSVLGAGAIGLVITGSPATALGAAGGAGFVMALSELTIEVENLEGTFDPQRRSVLGGVAALAGIGTVSAVRQTTANEPSAPEEPEALSQSDDGADPATVASTHTATGRRATPESATATPQVAVPGTEAQATRESPVSTPSKNETPLAETSTQSPTPEQSEIDRLLTEASEKSLEGLDLDPLVSELFYEVDINTVNPNVDTDSWNLSVTGAVETERSYTWGDITSISAEHRFVTLRCVGEQLNGKKMDNALWTGVPVDRFLAESKPSSDCECVMLRATDGYFEEFPLEALRGGLLAYGMNGELLPRQHGQPLRALVPGHWGEVNVKWLTEIELLEREKKGYWEKRGWHGTGPVHTVAKLHAIDKLHNGRVRVGGHAYAGTRGIEKVEVSIDGRDWKTATLSEPLPGVDVWRQWVHEYDAPETQHEVVVRAVDGTGTVQTREKSRPFPDGATGWVSRTIQ